MFTLAAVQTSLPDGGDEVEVVDVDEPVVVVVLDGVVEDVAVLEGAVGDDAVDPGAEVGGVAGGVTWPVDGEVVTSGTSGWSDTVESAIWTSCHAMNDTIAVAASQPATRVNLRTPPSSWRLNQLRVKWGSRIRQDGGGAGPAG